MSIALLFLLTFKYEAMNPFNLLINYVIANSRANFYNVSGNQEITNTALLTGMVSENPLMSYLIIDNKAKIEGEKFSPTVAVVTPVTSNTLAGTDTPTNTTETSTTPAGTNQSIEVVTLEAVKNEIAANNTILRDEITKILEINKEGLNKSIAEKVEAKIAFLENSNTVINESILEIKNRLDEIAKSNQALDTSAGTKGISNQKRSAKSDTK